MKQKKAFYCFCHLRANKQELQKITVSDNKLIKLIYCLGSNLNFNIKNHKFDNYAQHRKSIYFDSEIFIKLIDKLKVI